MIERFNILEWEEVIEEVNDQIKNYLNSGEVVLKSDFTEKKVPISIYAESTPNPSVMKFVANKKLVETNFSYVRIRGEISRPSFPGSGHIYFTLKDADGTIAAIIWKYTLPRLSIKPEEGIEVICTGKITTFAGQSKYQIIVDNMEVAGEGALLKMLEDRKKKLLAEGLFNPEHKKPIPYLPEIIGVITSPSGAVIKDILHRLSDRFPSHVYIWPVAWSSVAIKKYYSVGRVYRMIIVLIAFFWCGRRVNYPIRFCWTYPLL